MSRIGEDASISKGPGTVFHTAPKPGDYASIGDQAGGASARLLERFKALPLDLTVETAQGSFDAMRIVCWAE
jgi:hypothetical protein